MSYLRMKKGENALEVLEKICRLRDQLLEIRGSMPENVFYEIVLGKFAPSYESLRTMLDTIGEAGLTVADRSQKVGGRVISFGNALMTRQSKTSKSKLIRKMVKIVRKLVIFLRIVGVNPNTKKEMFSANVKMAIMYHIISIHFYHQQWHLKSILKILRVGLLTLVHLSMCHHRIET